MSTRTRIHNTTLIGIVLAVALAVVLIGLVMAPERKSTSPTVLTSPIASIVNQGGIVLPLVQLEGMWSNEAVGTRFAGEVSGNHIKIAIVGEDGESLDYWDGSFKTSDSPGSKIVSVKNKEVFVLSVDETKEFTIDTDSITFVFRVGSMGLTKKVVLTRA